jgi:hypothetical protein
MTDRRCERHHSADALVGARGDGGDVFGSRKARAGEPFRDGEHLMTRSEYKLLESAEAEKAIARETQEDSPRR